MYRHIDIREILFAHKSLTTVVRCFPHLLLTHEIMVSIIWLFGKGFAKVSVVIAITEPPSLLPNAFG